MIVQRVLAYLTEHPEGATDEQIADALGLAGNTARPRRRELEQSNLIKDSGRYALTKSGRKATLWVLAQSERAPYSNANAARLIASLCSSTTGSSKPPVRKNRSTAS